MTMRISTLGVLFAAVVALLAATEPGWAKPTLLVTDAEGDALLWVDPRKGELHRVKVGTAPFSVVTNGRDRAYVTSAEGVDYVDLKARRVIQRIAYAESSGRPRHGELRPGGMGAALSPDGAKLYVGVRTEEAWDRLDIIDLAAAKVVASVPIGQRPLEVLVSADGGTVFTVDHDTHGMTVVDTATLNRSQIDLSPLGDGVFDKPHYAVLIPDGRMFLPFQGKALLEYDHADGSMGMHGLNANTHQHGIAYCADYRTLAIIGTGPVGDADGDPSLSLFNLAEESEVLVPLKRPHEKLVLSPDCRHAYLTGGDFLSGGWRGITIVDLRKLTFRELPLNAFPHGIALAP